MGGPAELLSTWDLTVTGPFRDPVTVDDPPPAAAVVKTKEPQIVLATSP